MGKGYAPTGAFLSICTGPPARSMRSSSVLGAPVVDFVVDMDLSPFLRVVCMADSERPDQGKDGRQDGLMPDRSIRSRAARSAASCSIAVSTPTRAPSALR